MKSSLGLGGLGTSSADYKPSSLTPPPSANAAGPQVLCTADWTPPWESCLSRKRRMKEGVRGREERDRRKKTHWPS